MSRVELMPCPDCGKQPKMHQIPQGEYKYFCSVSGTHGDGGDWKNSVDEAAKVWNDMCLRRAEYNNPNLVLPELGRIGDSLGKVIREVSHIATRAKNIIAAQQAKIARVTKERDAAVDQVDRYCSTCAKHDEGCDILFCDSPCDDWQWCGVKEGQ